MKNLFKILVPSVLGITMISFVATTAPDNYGYNDSYNQGYSAGYNDGYYRSPDGSWYAPNIVYLDYNGNSYRNGNVYRYNSNRNQPKPSNVRTPIRNQPQINTNNTNPRVQSQNGNIRVQPQSHTNNPRVEPQNGNIRTQPQLNNQNNIRVQPQNNIRVQPQASPQNNIRVQPQTQENNSNQRSNGSR